MNSNLATTTTALGAAAVLVAGAVATGRADPVPAPGFRALADELRAVHIAASPSVVKIIVRVPGEPGTVRVGSGFGLDAQRVATTSELVGGCDLVHLQTSDGRTAPARVVGIDRFLGVAVVRPDGIDVPPLPHGDPDQIFPGSFVIALGYCYEPHPEPSLGLVAARSFGRSAPGGFPTWQLRTTALLAPGQAGAPLLTPSGEVVGMMLGTTESPIQTRALPIETVSRVADLISREGGSIRHGWMGVSVESTATLGGDPGVEVSAVRTRSPASAAGLSPGDRLVRIGDRSIHSLPDVFDAMLDVTVGAEVQIAVVRDGSSRMLNVVIGERPEMQIQPPIPIPPGLIPNLPSLAGPGGNPVLNAATPEAPNSPETDPE